ELRGDADGDSLLLRRGQEHERIDELVPRQGEGEDSGRENARHGDREDDVDHRLPARRAVDACAFLKLARDRLEVAHQQPGTEGDEEGGVCKNERPGCIAEAKVADDIGERNEQQRLWYEIGDEDTGAETAGERKFEPGERVAREEPAEKRDRRRKHGDEEG